MGAYSSFSLKKQLEIPVSIAEIENKLASYPEGKFEIKKISQGEYKFVSNSSFGTMVVKNSGPVEGIKIYASLSASNSQSVNIILQTKLRVEIIFIAAMMAFAIIFSLVTRFPQSIWATFIFPLVLLSFWFSYRAQELELISKVESYLETIQ